MKRQLIALGLLATSVMPVVIGQMPAHAGTVIINEKEGQTNDIGTLQQRSNYVLKGRFGGNPIDTQDRWDFRTSRNLSQKYRFTLSCFSLCPLKDEKVSIYRRPPKFGGRGKLVGTFSVNKPTSIFLPSARYILEVEGKSALSPGTKVGYQINLVTPG